MLLESVLSIWGGWLLCSLLLHRLLPVPAYFSFSWTLVLNIVRYSRSWSLNSCQPLPWVLPWLSCAIWKTNLKQLTGRSKSLNVSSPWEASVWCSGGSQRLNGFFPLLFPFSLFFPSLFFPIMGKQNNVKFMWAKQLKICEGKGFPLHIHSLLFAISAQWSAMAQRILRIGGCCVPLRCCWSHCCCLCLSSYSVKYWSTAELLWTRAIRTILSGGRY